MVNPIQLPVLLTQLPQLQKVQTALQSQPEAFQAWPRKRLSRSRRRRSIRFPSLRRQKGPFRWGRIRKGTRAALQERKRQKRESEGEEQQEPIEEKAPGRIIDLKV
jgi:hypothetical protein